MGTLVRCAVVLSMVKQSSKLHLRSNEAINVERLQIAPLAFKKKSFKAHVISDRRKE